MGRASVAHRSVGAAMSGIGVGRIGICGNGSGEGM